MYLLDANTYIQAKNYHYQMGFCPAYWDFLHQQFETGMLASVSQVYDELRGQNDELATWAEAHKQHFHLLTSKELQAKFSLIANHVMSLPNKAAASVSTFLAGADPWLIAVASLTNETVVTHEKSVADNSRKIKIPNICRDFNVSCIDPFKLLSELKAQFILEK